MDKITPFFRVGITIFRDRRDRGLDGCLRRGDRLCYPSCYPSISSICNQSVGVGCCDYQNAFCEIFRIVG